MIKIQCDDPLFWDKCAKSADILRAKRWPDYYISHDIKRKGENNASTHKNRTKEKQSCS